MKIAMSYLPPAFATVLVPMARSQSTLPQPKITGVLTILPPKPKENLMEEQFVPIGPLMPIGILIR